MSAEDYIFEDPCESYERCQMDDHYWRTTKRVDPFYADDIVSFKYIKIIDTPSTKATLFETKHGLCWLPNSQIRIQEEKHKVTLPEWLKERRRFFKNDAT